MSTAVVITIAALVIVGGGAGLFAFVSRARHDESSVVGYLSDETVGKDVDVAKHTGVAKHAAQSSSLESAAKGLEAFDPAPAPPAQTWSAPDEELIGQTRRQFLNRGIITVTLLGVASFGGSVLAFLWPPTSAGSGSKINAGKKDDVLGAIQQTKVPVYNAAGKFYLTDYDPAYLNDAAKKIYRSDIYDGLAETGVIALWQKCPHLGCRVPWCSSSQWFECPCHGSQYNKVGQKRGGPAPRGMDVFPTKLEGDQLIVDISLRAEGVPVGTNTTGQEPEGPHCVG